MPINDQDAETLKIQIAHLSNDLMEMRSAHQKLLRESTKRNIAVDEMLSMYNKLFRRITGMVDAILEDEQANEGDGWKPEGYIPPWTASDEEDSE